MHAILTRPGMSWMQIMPIIRPHTAPMRREGMKTPLDTIRPYVQVASKWYTINRTIRAPYVHSSEKYKSNLIKLRFVDCQIMYNHISLYHIIHIDNK